jgi:hypothetical protein
MVGDPNFLGSVVDPNPAFVPRKDSGTPNPGVRYRTHLT